MKINKVQRKFNFSLEEKRFFGAGDRVGVAISSGGDSVGLFHLLKQVALPKGLQLALVHLNHKLRGADSDEDELFVKELALLHNLPIFCQEIDVAGEANRKGANLEATARRLRYEFFQSLIRDGHLDKIATGHTANDQAETVLLRLLRGSGTEGLAGIYPNLEGKIVRPLLGIARQEILEFLKEKCLPFRVDQSNFDKRFLRNRVRADLLPKLEQEFNPQITKLLSELAERSRDEEDYLKRAAEYWLKKSTTNTRGRHSIPLSALRQLPPALERKVLRSAIRDFSSGSASLTHNQIEALRRFTADRSGSGKIPLPCNLIIHKEFGNLVLTKQEVPPRTYRYSIKAPGEQEIPSLGLVLQFKIIDTRTMRGKYNGVRLKAGVDWHKIATPLVVRNWEAGDRFQPTGRQEPVKLKRLLCRHKISASRKRLWPVVTANGKVIWVKNLSVGKNVAVTPETRQILLIREKKTKDE